MSNRKQFQDIVNRYRNNQCTDQEVHWLQSYIQSGEDQDWVEREMANTLLEPVPVAFLEKGDVQEELKEVYNRILKQKASSFSDIDSIGTVSSDSVSIPTPAKRIVGNWLFKAAAVALIALSVGIYFYNSDSDYSNITQFAKQVDIQPGGNRATLTLADGRMIDLNDDQEGIILDAENIKYNDGDLVFQSEIEESLSTSPVNSPERLLALSTPNGGEYQITLPDGTKVWLNAASTLKYPGHFNGKERRVELKGEAYFEVAKNEKQPFIVTSEGQEVTVLGTHFNINAYADEKETKTTLIEGAVRVAGIVNSRISSENTILKPNDQSVMSDNSDRIRIEVVNPESAMGWKNGVFIFKDQSFETTMRQIARWYNVEIKYEDDAPVNLKLGGTVSRSNTLLNVLAAMESAGKIKLSLKGNVIRVKRITN